MAGEQERELAVQLSCICPDGRHGEKGDTVTFRETLGYVAVRAIRYTAAAAREADPDTTVATLMAAINEAFILYGIESWTLRDAKRRPIPVDPTTIRRFILNNIAVALEVGDRADDLYQEQVFLPLAVLAARSSQPSPTTESTSPPNGSSSTSRPSTNGASRSTSGGRSSRSAKSPKPSRPSSTTTTRTGDTGPTSASFAGG